MHKHPRKMVTYSVKNVNEETNSPSMKTFPRPPDGLLQAVGLQNAGRYKSL